MFTLTEEHLLRLWELNHFPVPKDRWVFFGLRGCLPVNDTASLFAESHPVRVEPVDYLHPRCTLGQWQPGGGFTLFPGSTVPHRTHITASRPTGGAGPNQLLTGCYSDYRKGRHKAGMATGHEAFRQDNKLPIQRSSDDLDFDPDDRVEFEQPFDNLHAAWSHGVDHESYASAGCQVVVGFPQCLKRNNRPGTGPWEIFKANAYAIPQESFFYVLLTGHEAERLAQASTSPIPRLRYGSQGPLVTKVQEALRKEGFYEGRLDQEFGIRTLRALLQFQTTEFGARGDDGIVGAQTASALGIDWPVQPTPSIAVSRAAPLSPAASGVPGAAAMPPPPPPASRGTVRFQGDHAVGPDGTRFAKRFRKGVFNIGATSIRDYVSTHLAAFPGVSRSLLSVIQAVSENEGKLEAINTWDDSFMTFGVFQWTAGQANARGELAALLHRLKGEHGGAFNDLFGRHGLDVHNVSSFRPGVTPVGALALDGVLLDTPARKEQLRTLDWAHRFWVAGHDERVRTAQVKQAMDRLAIFYRSPKHLVFERPVAAYVTSEAGVALILDQHVNRPGHVPKTIAQAVAQLTGDGLPADPSSWSDAEERQLLKTYIDQRSKTSMTDSDKRAQVVIEAVMDGRISDRRGSFVDAT